MSPTTRSLLLLASPCLAAAQDTLGLANGYVNLRTANFEVQLVRDAQTLASLRPTGSNFDFLPLDYLPRRARNGQYHWGDLTVRYRAANTSTSTWADANSAAARKQVSSLRTNSLSAANLASTLPTSTPLNVTREWIDISGDLGLRFTLTNTAKTALEIGSLGFPAEFNSIFTGRTADQIQQRCSLTDPYIGMHAGYLRVTPVRGTGPVLLVTPLGDTPFEAWRNLAEPAFSDTGYGSQTFEGLYEWQTLTAAWATREWAAAEPWNPPSSRILQLGESLSVGLRFSLTKNGVRDIDSALVSAGIPAVAGVPGYVVPRGVPAQLSVRMPANLTVASTRVNPPGSLLVARVKDTIYQITPDPAAWGRARLSLVYSDGRAQTVHYWVTKAADETVSDLGRFLTTRQLFNDTTDPFGRAPSIMSYDYESRAIVVQDNRVWIAGLSDEGGAGSFLAAAVKQAVQPQAEEVAKLEEFVDRVLWGRLQNADYSVRKSLFFYQPSLVPGFVYANGVDWGSWMSWDRPKAYLTDRAYNYVHVVATYWALYRAGRAHPGILSRHTWDWYLDQAHNTVIRCMAGNVGYSRDGLMGETVFGEVLQDLIREGRTTQATSLEASMRTRARQWDASSNPYGSEMSWDSTGQEGVYYWSRYFGYNATATKTLNTVLGYAPTVPHWGWNGNARRYWDNQYAGKTRRIERQIHHYGSALNALVLLSAFRNDPGDTYMLRVGYGGLTGALSNINGEGFASASFHSWPDMLKWDAYSGDYGPGFVGLALGSGTYLVHDQDLGSVVVYGGAMTLTGDATTVVPQDSFRRRIFVGPMRLLVSIDAGVISSFTLRISDSTLSLTLAQREGGAAAPAAVMWLETTGSVKYAVTTPGLSQTRLGWRIPLGSSPVVVTVAAT